MARRCHIEGKVCLSQKESVVLFTICKDGFKGCKYQGDSHSSVVFNLQAVSMYYVVCTLCVQQCIVFPFLFTLPLDMITTCSYLFTAGPFSFLFTLSTQLSLCCGTTTTSCQQLHQHHFSSSKDIEFSIHVLFLFTGFFFQETFEIARRSKDQTSTSQCHAIATGLQGRIAPIQ